MLINFPRVLEPSVDFRKSLERILSADLTEAASLNTISLWRDGDEIKVSAEIPGAKKESVNLEIRNDILRIYGERKHPHRNHQVDGGNLKFDSSLRLPVAVDQERAKATYEDGVLSVSLPVAERAKVKKIAID